MRAFLHTALATALKSIGAHETTYLAPPQEAGHGDMATSVALKLARATGREPRRIAEEIVAALPAGVAEVAAVEIAGPGFINFTFTPEFFYARLRDVLQAGAAYGHAVLGPGALAAAARAYAIDPARAGSDDDPLRPVRFARAQAAGLLRHAAARGITPAADTPLDALSNREEVDLIKEIILYPERAERAAAADDPALLVAYLFDLAAAFSRFDRAQRVMAEPVPVRDARLCLAWGAAIVFENALGMLGVV
jgi:arginyl-tRNA synthetase